MKTLTESGSKPKYERIRQTLYRRILGGEYPVGSRLPSVRLLSEQFSVSPATAFRCVQELARDRLVTSHAGRRGTVVARREPIEGGIERTTLACLLRPHRPRNEHDNFGIDIIQGLRDAISAQGYRFVYHCVDEADYARRVADLAEQPWIAGMVLDQCTPDDVVAELAAKGLPTVIFNRVVNLENLSSVTPDYERVGAESYRILRQRGYARVALYSREVVTNMARALFSPGEMMGDGFIGAASAAGLGAGHFHDIPDVVPKDPVRNEPEQFGLPRRKPADWTPLGIFALNDIRARQIADVLRKTDLALGRDVGLIGTCDLPCNLGGNPPFSTWSIDAHEIGTETVRELLARVKDPALPRSTVKLTAVFVDRGTA